MVKSKKGLPSVLKGAEIVLTNGSKFAAAFSYTPRNTPEVIAKGKGKNAADIIWVAQELNIPIVETTLFNQQFYGFLKEGKEIPSELFSPVGQALSFLYKTKDDPHFIRYIKPLRNRPSIADKKAAEMTEKYADIYDLSMVSLELGKELFDSVKKLEDPLDTLRRRVATEVGLIVPPITAVLNPKLDNIEYNICIRAVPFVNGSADGIEFHEFVALLINKLKNLILKEGWQFLGYTEIEAILEQAKKREPQLCDYVFSTSFSVPSFRFILRNLLMEGFSIRDVDRILEVIKENLHITTDPDILTEYVRASFSQMISSKYTDADGIINAILLSPSAEDRVIMSIREMLSVSIFDMGARDTFSFLNSIKSVIDSAAELGIKPVLLVNPSIRRFLRRFLDTSFPSLPIISYSEIYSFTNVRSFSVIP